MREPPTYNTLLQTMKHLADPDDECHDGYCGPWIDLAQEALGFKISDGGDWYEDDGKKRSVEQMMEKYAYPK